MAKEWHLLLSSLPIFLEPFLLSPSFRLPHYSLHTVISLPWFVLPLRILTDPLQQGISFRCFCSFPIITHTNSAVAFWASLEQFLTLSTSFIFACLRVRAKFYSSTIWSFTSLISSWISSRTKVDVLEILLQYSINNPKSYSFPLYLELCFSWFVH